MESVDLNDPKPIKSQYDYPDLIKAQYTDDLDIIKIHNTIKYIFSLKLGNIDRMKQEIKNKKDEISDYLTQIEVKKIKEEIEIINKEIINLESMNSWREYINKVSNILKEYYLIASKKTKNIISFTKEENVQESSYVIDKRCKLIKDYLLIAEKYIKLDIIWNKNLTFHCPNCDISFDNILLDEEEGSYICKCGFIINNLSKVCVYKDSSRITIGNKLLYDDKLTFIKAMDRFEGKKVIDIPQKLYDLLDNYFKENNFPTGEEIRKMPLNLRKKKDNTSIELMVKALNKTNNTFYYDYVQYIAHIYWGWQLPDLSSIREGILEDYDITQKVYEEIKERGSSLNVQIRMFYHYRARNYECELSDFKILDSRSSLEYHQKMLKIMSERTGVKFTNII
jgi:hypothetical protein